MHIDTKRSAEVKYEQLIEAIWYLFYNREVSFKRFLIELSGVCNTLVDNEERRRSLHP